MKNLRELTKEYLLPVRVVAAENCENTERLLTASDRQVYLSYTSPLCKLKSGGYILLDFGEELHGGIRILTAFDKNSAFPDIRIRFGESVGEACSDIGDTGGATNDHATRDMKVFIPRASGLEFGPTGFRFVRIDNLGDTVYEFVSINAYFEHLRELPTGSFNCSDALLNKIYAIAARTVFLNMQTRVWDGIKRDRLVWIGDMHPEVKSIFALYGAHPLLEDSLKETAEHNPVTKWMNGIPSYSLWWLAILCDYYTYTANADFVKSLLPYATALVEKISDCVDNDGNLSYGGKDEFELFLNWESLQESGKESGNRGLMLWALKKFVKVAKIFGKSTDTAEKTIERLLKNGKFCGVSKTVAAMYALGYGITDEVKKIIEAGGADGYSTFMSSYVGNALADIGRTDKALSDMKEFYGGMIERGATSFWESFDTSWLIGSGRIDEFTPEGLKDIHSSFGKYCYTGYRLSLCHGWASGPVSFLTERVLGVRFSEAGGKKIKIKPELCGLTFAEGRVPTAYGNIYVKHTLNADGSVKTEVSAPDGVEIE